MLTATDARRRHRPVMGVPGSVLTGLSDGPNQLIYDGGQMVRDTTDVIERLSIEAALEITRDNRASAAEMLGLSRQSLYVKLRRYGLADSNRDEADDG